MVLVDYIGIFYYMWQYFWPHAVCSIVMFKLCTNKNHSYKHNEQINRQNIDNSECFGVKFVKIYPEITPQ
jgi:hypothetical protein